MDSASISGLAALGGDLIGGLTSFAASWVSQQTQVRAQQVAHKLTRREDLYKDFIEEASKLYADSLIHDTPDVSQLIRLYGRGQSCSNGSLTPIWRPIRLSPSCGTW